MRRVLVLIILILLMSQFIFAQESAPKISLKDLNGRSVNLDSIWLKGVTIIDFWATWCTPCKESLPHLNDLNEKYSEKGLQVLAVSIDGTKSIDKVRPYIIEQGFSFSVYLDPKAEALKAFGGKNIPHTVIIDKQGKIAYTKYGFLPGDEEDFEKVILQLLNTESNE